MSGRSGRGSSVDSDGDVLLVPITQLSDDEYDDEDASSAQDASDERGSDSSEEEVEEKKPKAFMSLRQRRLSRALATFDLKVNVSKAQRNWVNAIRKARKMDDPWEEFHIEQLETEKVLRHRWNALKKAWVTDEAKVKIEAKAFNRGAMRSCFRLKKLSKFTGSENWKHAGNYVAKLYMENVDRDVYFQDVRLQMEAKLWGEEYNRHNPPKKVDIFQMSIIEFKNRKDQPLYHLEHFMEGEYIKYNSNSGFVEQTLRHTPQVFSHFTFERSGHQLIVVDVQGVGDLYTDPQIHTIDGQEYGDGNLGAKGMALFFHSHVCNDICRSLGLSEFDKSSAELELEKDVVKHQKMVAHTIARGSESLCMSPSPGEKIDVTCFLQLGRKRSDSSSCSVESGFSSFANTPLEDEPMSIDSPVGRVRMRWMSESESSVTAEEEDLKAFQMSVARKSRASCVAMEKDFRLLMKAKLNDSTLGKIHHEIAKYYEVGRFNNRDVEDNIDWESAMYHEEHAAELGELEAILTMAKLYLGLERDVLLNCTVESTEENLNRGMDYMVQAAEAGNREAMLYVAKAFETGNGLGTNRSVSWEDAICWYDEAIETNDNDEGGEYDAMMYDPIYQLLAKEAEMYRAGGHGLDKDPNKAGELYNRAGEEASAAMKGRLANKYYMLAEEAWGEVEEEEEESG